LFGQPTEAPAKLSLQRFGHAFLLRSQIAFNKAFIARRLEQNIAPG
jgi:hypothetical protein